MTSDSDSSQPHPDDATQRALLDALADTTGAFEQAADSLATADGADEVLANPTIWARLRLVDILRSVVDCPPGKVLRRSLSEFGPSIGIGALTNRRTRW
jgi:hypothetical protein